MTRAVRFLAIAAAIAGFALSAQGQSIGINFGADEPDPGDPGNSSFVNGPAGVLGTATWNNTEGASGFGVNLVDDSGAATGAIVDWISNNTWSSTGRPGEENNTAPPGDDRNLMSGYLDTTDTSLTEVIVDGLGPAFTGPGYDVYVYIKGGVNGRGGDYTIGPETQSHVDTAPFDGTYIFGSEGDYLIFEGQSESGFTLTATPTTPALFRAPINGVEIVAIPEPAGVVLLGTGMIGLLIGWVVRRRRTRA